MVPLRPRPTWQYAGQVVYDETRRQFQWVCMAATVAVEVHGTKEKQ